MTDSDSAIAREAIFEMIQNQMRDGTPAETKQTYDRLIADGHSHEQTMKLIGRVLTTETFDMLKQKQPYNEERYIAALNALPELPSDDDED